MTNFIMSKEEYLSYMSSEAWQEVAKQVKARDGKCQCCDTGAAEIAHHLSYYRLNRDRKDDLDVIMAVCKDCHEYIHRKGQYAEHATATE